MPKSFEESMQEIQDLHNQVRYYALASALFALMVGMTLGLLFCGGPAWLG